MIADKEKNKKEKKRREKNKLIGNIKSTNTDTFGFGSDNITTTMNNYPFLSPIFFLFIIILDLMHDYCMLLLYVTLASFNDDVLGSSAVQLG